MADVNADWLEELRRRVTPENVDMIAEQLDVLSGMIIAALADGDGGEFRLHLADRVRGEFLGVMVDCPASCGMPMNRRYCIEQQARASRKFYADVQGLERHCRAGCPHSHLTQDIFD